MEVSQRPYPLATSYTQLIVHLKGKDYVRSLKCRDPNFLDKSKFYEFHNDADHYTVDYRQLTIEIA